MDYVNFIVRSIRYNPAGQFGGLLGLLVGWLAELTGLDGYMDRNETETTPHEEEVVFPSTLLMIVGC